MEVTLLLAIANDFVLIATAKVQQILNLSKEYLEL